MALQTRQHRVRSPFRRETRWDSSIERLSFLHQRLFCSFCPFQGAIASARAWLSEKKSGKMCLWEMCREESGAAGDGCTDRPVDFAACWRNPPLHETGDLDGRLANFLVVVLLFSNIVVNPPVYKRANFMCGPGVHCIDESAESSVGRAGGAFSKSSIRRTLVFISREKSFHLGDARCILKLFRRSWLEMITSNGNRCVLNECFLPFHVESSHLQ